MSDERSPHSELVEAIRNVLGPRPTSLPDSAPPYMKRDNENLIAAWAALDSLADADYSPAYQDEYQRLWHESQERVRNLEEQLEAAQRDNGRLALEAATADQDWKRAEAEVEKLRHALTQVRAECDLPDYIAEFVGEVLNDSLTPSSPNVRKSWGPERMRHDPERLS